MGYLIRLEKAEFRFTNNQAKEEALSEIKELMDDPSATRSGYNSTKGAVFSWMHDASPEEWGTVEDALRAWRFKPVKEDGEIVSLQFTGQKIGDEDQLFERISPYVTDDSILRFSGEDGRTWHITFN